MSITKFNIGHYKQYKQYKERIVIQYAIVKYKIIKP